MIESVYSKENVCAVVISFNNNGCISNSVNALIGQVGKIIIVDNGSDLATVSALRKLESKLICVIYNELNKGIAAALNQGVRSAVNDNFNWILTMDQDSIADVAMVNNLLVCAHKFKECVNVVSFSPNIILDNNVKTADDTCEERCTVITSGNLIRSDIFSKIGYYEEKLFIDSVDFDFCLRLLVNNYRIIRCHNSKLYHTIGDPLKSNVMGLEFVSYNHSPIRKYYIMRNNYYILQKYIFKFPMFCLRKQFGMLAIVLHVIFFENDKYAKLTYMFSGLLDGFYGNYGKKKEN